MSLMVVPPMLSVQVLRHVLAAVAKILVPPATLVVLRQFVYLKTIEQLVGAQVA